jgi:hypothetical protein
VLQKWAAHKQSFEPARESRMTSAFQKPATRANDVAQHAAIRRQFFGNAGKKRLQCLSSSRQQSMRVPALRHARPIRLRAVELVAFNYGDSLVPLGQHLARKQTSHAPANYNRMFLSHNL